MTPTASWLADSSENSAHNEQAQLQICFPKRAESGVACRLCANKIPNFGRIAIGLTFSASVNVVSQVSYCMRRRHSMLKYSTVIGKFIVFRSVFKTHHTASNCLLSYIYHIFDKIVFCCTSFASEKSIYEGHDCKIWILWK